MSLEVTTSTYVFSMSGDVYLSLASYPGFGGGGGGGSLVLLFAHALNLPDKSETIALYVHPHNHDVIMCAYHCIVGSSTHLLRSRRAPPSILTL